MYKRERVSRVVQERHKELVIEIGTSVGNISGPGESSKEWHQMQRKIKEKGIMVQREKFCTHDIIHGAPHKGISKGGMA